MSRIPPDWDKRLRHPVVVGFAVRFGIQVGQETRKYWSGEVNADQYKKKMGQCVGSLTGSAGGAALGAGIGSLIPGVGTLVGAFGGAMAGELLGEYATRWGAERLQGRVGGSSSDPSPEAGGAEFTEPGRTEPDAERPGDEADEELG